LFLISVAVSLIGVASTASAGDVEALYKAAGDGDSAEVTALLADPLILSKGPRPNSLRRADLCRLMVSHIEAT
jgi:hypothetical protein